MCRSSSSALCGDRFWIPLNNSLDVEGISDSVEKARLYILNTVGDRLDQEM